MKPASGSYLLGHGRELSERYKTKLQTCLEMFEGADAIYRERDRIAHMRVHNIKLTDVGNPCRHWTAANGKACQSRGRLAVFCGLGLFSVTDSSWSASYPVSISLYF